MKMGSNGFPFNLNKNIQYKRGMCPVVEKLHNKEFFTLNLVLTI